LEKDRISLELEEEKKALAQREERLLEQARKIDNLSSLVLLSDRDEKAAPSFKGKCSNFISRYWNVINISMPNSHVLHQLHIFQLSR